MTLKKEISSTEKLLEVIRRKKAPHVPDMTPRPQQRAGKKPSLIKALTSQRGTHSVGVDFGYRHLFLVKVCRHSEDHWTLCDYRTVPLPADGSRNTPAFGEFVKRELDSFCGQERNVGIWANMSSAKAEVSAIRIPKVSRGQLENAVRWNAKKAISLEEGTSILDFKVQGEVIESGVTKLNVLVYAAPRDDVADMRKLFEGIGYSLEGLIISPFGIQNLFGTGWIARKEETVASLYIGRNWSRIDIFNKGVLVMTRDIRAGMNSMIMDLMETYNEGADKTSEEETTVSSAAPVEELIMDIEEARDLVFSLGADVPTTEEIRSRFGLDDESIFKLMNAAVDRLVRQVDRTFRHYTVTLGNEKVTAIYVSSSALVYEPLVTYIGKELAVDHAVLDPLDPDNPSVEDRTAGMTASERAPYSVALGAALSERARTPNFLMTQKDKKKQVNIKLINRSIFIALAAALLICVGAVVVIGNMADKKKTMLASLERQYRQGVQVDKKVIPLFISKIKKDRDYIEAYGDRYRGVAALTELSRLTPSNVRLLSVSARLDNTVKQGETAGKGWMTIEGIISPGNGKTLEDSLVEYVLKLQGSSMFSQAKVTKSSPEGLQESEILRFSLTVNFA